MYNVKDYGAKGDGVTDDTESFKTTISAARGNGVVIVPSGSYIINNVDILSRTWSSKVPSVLPETG